MRRENVPNSLSFPHPPLPPSSSHSLSPSWTFGHTPFWRRDVNIWISFVLADVNRAFSSSVFAFLAFEAIARTKAQALCVAALCGWGRKFSLKRNFWDEKFNENYISFQKDIFMSNNIFSKSYFACMDVLGRLFKEKFGFFCSKRHLVWHHHFQGSGCLVACESDRCAFCLSVCVCQHPMK